MSMLAERRRKAKWALNPGRQALWNKDDSSGIKFGQGLMEKMGWKVGHGLGLNEQGIKEPLKIVMKNDSKGMGFKENDNEWIQQQQDFNELLGQLSSSSNTVEKNICNDSKSKQLKTSLEEKSRHSKSRVHYHKFTREKDLTKYSEKDLECILGQKIESCNDVVNCKHSIDSYLKLETASSVNHAGSMIDYFSQKMQEKVTAGGIKQLRVGNREKGLEMECGYNTEEAEHIYIVKKEKKKRKKEKETESCKVLIDGTTDNQVCESEHFTQTTLSNDLKGTLNYESNKQSNNQKEQLNAVKNKDSSQYSSDERNENKNNKMAENFDEEEFVNSSPNNIENKPKKRKKERRKEKDADEYNNLGCINQLENEEFIHSEKKGMNEDSLVRFPNQILSSEKKRDAKKIKNAIDSPIDFEGQRKRNKKKKRCKEEDGMKRENVDDSDMMNLVREPERKIRKRKSKGASPDDDTAVICENKWNGEEDECHKETRNKEKLKFCDSATYKTELSRKGSDGIIESNPTKILDLICCTNVEKFQGSNLRQVKGYGIVRYINDNSKS